MFREAYIEFAKVTKSGERHTMNPSQQGPYTGSMNFQPSADASPLSALKAPTVIHPVHTSLLASRTRPDGGRDELYHEIPSMDGHKGAVFYISDTPAVDPREDHLVHQRVFYTMVPRSGSEQFVSNIVERFSTSPLPFEDLFTNSFQGHLLVEYPKSAK